MNQIMRLRRIAGNEHGVDDVNNGHRHEIAFVKIIEKKGTLDESLLLQESYAPGIKGKLMPTLASIKGLLESIPTAIRGIRTGKMRSVPKLIPGVHHKLPGRLAGPRQADLRARRGEPRRAQPLHHRRGRRGGRRSRGQEGPGGRHRVRREAEEALR